MCGKRSDITKPTHTTSNIEKKSKGSPAEHKPRSKTYDKVKILDKKCVTEISELKCSTGGKITILKHGQQSQSS
ncbi:PAAR-like protein, partial [Flavobacterium covae]